MVHLHGCAHVSCHAVQLRSAGELASAGVPVELKPSAVGRTRGRQTLHKQAWRLAGSLPLERGPLLLSSPLPGLTDSKLPAFCSRLRVAAALMKARPCGPAPRPR